MRGGFFQCVGNAELYAQERSPAPSWTQLCPRAENHSHHHITVRNPFWPDKVSGQIYFGRKMSKLVGKRLCLTVISNPAYEHGRYCNYIRVEFCFTA